MSYRDATPASVHVLGAVCGVTPEGSIVEVPSASQRRLLGLLAVHAPRQLRAEWLADVLGVTTGALRTTVSRLRTTIGPATLRTTSTGYSLEGDVDAIQFCSAVGNADKTTDKLGALEQALTLWTGPVLEEFQGEEWARGETARLTEIHAASVDDYVDQLISAHRETDAIAAAEAQIGQYPYRDRSRGLLIRALALARRQADALRAFQTYRSLLVEGFGTEPSSEVVRTERRVASGLSHRGLLSGRPDRARRGALRASAPSTVVCHPAARGQCGIPDLAPSTSGGRMYMQAADRRGRCIRHRRARRCLATDCGRTPAVR